MEYGLNRSGGSRGGIKIMRNNGATSQNSVLFSARHFRNLDLVRPYRIHLHKGIHRTPWLPPFVLCVCCNCMSADRTIKSEDGGSQDERAISLRREIFIDCTVSRIHQPAREVMGLGDFLRKSPVAT